MSFKVDGLPGLSWISMYAELDNSFLIFFPFIFVYIFFILCSEAIIEPAAIFAMLFGSELFMDYIGQLAMASMASLDIFTEGEQLDTKKLQEKMRVRSLVYHYLSSTKPLAFH
jgi:hypothetical protein